MNNSGPAMSMAALDLFGCPLAESEVAGLALLDHLLQRLDRLLDRHSQIKPMGLIKVDVVGAQPVQDASIWVSI
jgi:hypothetical protein